MAMTRKFWRLDSPDYDSDYSHSYINGSLEHSFGLPGVCCDVCGATWAGSRVLARECPLGLRQHKNLLQGWPISRTDHANLQQEVMAAFGIQGKPFVDLQPGDEFQPCFLEVPSRPRADFLWPSLGSFLVADRIRDVLLERCQTDVSIWPVSLRKIGKLSAELPPPMPSTGEPEDIINEVPLMEDPAGAGNYSEVLILNESGIPLGGVPVSICKGCKREEIAENGQFRMTQEMWKGHEMFFMATTLYVIITDDLRNAIERLRPTNVAFKPI
jgi:hypothetical protein